MLFGNTTSQQQPAAGGGLFGSTNPPQQQQTTGGGLFGSTTSSQQPPATGGGLFGGTTQPTAPAGGSIFGGTTQPTTTGNIFGSTTQAPAGGSIFGGATQPASGGSILGSTTAQPAGGSLFGTTNTQQSQQQPTGSSLFGTTTTQPQQSGGGLFGASTNTQQQQQPSAGGLFGTNATAQPTPNLFGGATTTAPAQGAGLFGNSTQASNPLFGNKAPSSIFGAPGTGTTMGTSTISPPTLFGQPATQTSINTAQPTTSLFGQPTQPQQPQKPAGSLFGSTAQPSTTGTLFGNTLAPPTFGAGLGTGSILGTSTSRSSQSAQQQDPQSQIVALTQRIDAIADAWNPNSPLCRFQVSITCGTRRRIDTDDPQHYFYNLVDPALVGQYGRPANATNEAFWQRAVRENPEASWYVINAFSRKVYVKVVCFSMVPVLAVGFDALNARVEAQSAQATAQQEKLKVT